MANMIRTKSRFVIGFWVLLSILAAAFVWYDSRDYRAALSDMGTKASTQRLNADSEVLSAEIDGWGGCRNAVFKRENVPDLKLADVDRPCMMKMLSQTKTPVGALASSLMVSKWLLTHPADEEMRTAALGMVSTARAYLLAQKSWRDDPFFKVNQACTKSTMARLINKCGLEEHPFMFWSSKLNEVEDRILIPAVADARDKRILAAFKGD